MSRSVRCLLSAPLIEMCHSYTSIARLNAILFKVSIKHYALQQMLPCTFGLDFSLGWYGIPFRWRFICYQLSKRLTDTRGFIPQNTDRYKVHVWPNSDQSIHFHYQNASLKHQLCQQRMLKHDTAIQFCRPRQPASNIGHNFQHTTTSLAVVVLAYR